MWSAFEEYQKEEEAEAAAEEAVAGEGRKRIKYPKARAVCE